MFKCLKSLVYPVANIETARDWYVKLLGTKPVIDTPFKVAFDINGIKLALVPERTNHSGTPSGGYSVWQVDNIDFAYNELINAGATCVTKVTKSIDAYCATLRDPFGNIITITGDIEISQNTVEHKPSETAMGVAYLRAFAAMDEREEIRGGDYMAKLFAGDDKGLSDPKIRRYMLEKHINYGIYEFILARSAFLDEEVKRALNEDIPQMVFLGAGYDSRPYRFKDIIKRTKMFELDISPTQNQKIEILKKANISAPDNLKYVTIDFNKDKLDKALFNAGYDKSLKTLFIWEGVIYYLSQAAIDKTFEFIKSNSAAGSSICFDYCHPYEELIDEYGVRDSIQHRSKRHKSEPIVFRLGKGKIEHFLSERGFKLLLHLNSQEMEKKYLTLKNGNIAGKVTALYCLAHAAVA